MHSWQNELLSIHYLIICRSHYRAKHVTFSRWWLLVSAGLPSLNKSATGPVLGYESVDQRSSTSIMGLAENFSTHTMLMASCRIMLRDKGSIINATNILSNDANAPDSSSRHPVQSTPNIPTHHDMWFTMTLWVDSEKKHEFPNRWYSFMGQLLSRLWKAHVRSKSPEQLGFMALVDGIIRDGVEPTDIEISAGANANSWWGGSCRWRTSYGEFSGFGGFDFEIVIESGSCVLLHNVLRRLFK